MRDRQGTIKFSSSILPRYLRRTKSLEELLPWLYLKGLSTGDFTTALTALLGQDAPGLSATTVSRLKEVWKEEYAHWSRRNLTGKNYVYLWVDGVHPDMPPNAALQLRRAMSIQAAKKKVA